MGLKTYTFLFRDNGTLRCISNTLWQRLLERKKPFFSVESKQLTIGEIQIEQLTQHSSTVRQVCIWDVSVNAHGYIEHVEPQRLACPDLKASLDQLFQRGSADTELLLMDFIDGLVKEDVNVCTLAPVLDNYEERYIDRLLAQR